MIIYPLTFIFETYIGQLLLTIIEGEVMCNDDWYILSNVSLSIQQHLTYNVVFIHCYTYIYIYNFMMINIQFNIS